MNYMYVNEQGNVRTTDQYRNELVIFNIHEGGTQSRVHTQTYYRMNAFVNKTMSLTSFVLSTVKK